MCDQTEVTYHDGDVVWVKIGPIWWPGVVKDVEKDGSASEILAGLRTKPIAVVQFFDEDTYEFVKNLDNIYHYNCRRKDEFIKKGLEKHRKGVSHMKKFPEDVKKAQKLVNEDENILNSPKYAPAEKVNYNDIFGTSPKKKEKKDELALRTKILPLKKRLSAPVSAPKYKGKHSCPKCDFSIDNLDILMVHIKYNHSSKKVDYSVPGHAIPLPEPKRRNTTTPKPRKKPIPKVATPVTPKTKEPAENKKETAPKPSTPAAKPSVKAEKSAEKKKRYTDVLLADWSEEDQNRDEEEEEDEEKPKTDLNENNSSEEVVDEKEPKVEKPEEKKPEEKKPAVQPVGKSEPPSCFDFDEEDDGFIGMSNANTYGRKIPRVIPDKIELGMDPEIEELFKRKPESEQEEEAPQPPAKKRRGRPPKSSKVADAPKESPKVSDESLASTRERRPGALKSYVGEVIEKIPTAEDPIVDDEPPKPPSRRKQDLKRQSMKELDELEAFVAAKRRTERADVDYTPPLNARLTPKKKDPELEAQKKRLSDFNSIEANTEALLAELGDDAGKVGVDDECMDGTVEYLEDEPEPVLPSPGKNIITSPIKKWKEDIRLAMDGDSPVKKSIIPQWKQDIQEAMKANKEPQQIKKIVFSGKSLEPGTSNLVKVSKLTNKGNNTLVIVPESRKIINKQQQVVFLSKQPATNKPIVVTNKPQPTKVATQPFLKLISDGNGGTKKVVSQKVVQIGTKASPSTYVLSGTKRESGIQVMRNFNGTGKTVILGGGQTVYRRLKTTPAPGTSAGKPTQCIVKTVKAPMSQYKTVRLFSPDKPQTIVPQQRQYILKSSEPKPVKITQPEPEPVVQQVVQVQPQTIAVGTQQVVAMQNPEGQTTYMLVTVDSSGNVQLPDSSLLTYDVQPEVAPQLYEPTTDDLTPTYSSAGQDILAEALANTNVLESEMPLTSLIMPSMEGRTTDNPVLISKPHVQETSVTLQSPIMSPVEVPSSVVADTTGLQPPPLPPTPTQEDVLLEETDSGLMIAEQEQQPQTEEDTGPTVIQAPDVEEHFFIDDSQEGEANTFQSMPLLTEDTTTIEEPIEGQEFAQSEQDVVTTEYLSSTTTAHIEEEAAHDDLSKFEQGLPEVAAGMYTNDGSQLIFNVQEESSSLGVVTTEGDSTHQAEELDSGNIG